MAYMAGWRNLDKQQQAGSCLSLYLFLRAIVLIKFKPLLL